MAWWHRFFAPSDGDPSKNTEYRVVCNLYNSEGKRGAEVRVRRDGRAYFVEQEWVEGTTFTDRGRGEEIGPFESPEAAERAAVGRPWFSGDENSD
jgi:hypothetical protein